MAETADRRLTKLSFRRDVRLFLTALGCFFAVLVAILLLLLQQAAREAQGASMEQWSTIADAVVSDIAAAVTSGRTSNVGVLLTAMRARHPIARAEATLTSGERFVTGSATDTGAAVVRKTVWGTLRIVFDDSRLVSLSRTIRFTTGIIAFATTGGLLLLLLYIPRIVQPIEALLDQAAEVQERHPAMDEQAYLLDTFRKTVATLKLQQDELRTLHDQQKSRADELDRVTAALTRGMTSGVIAIDPTGRIIQINQAGLEILRLRATADGGSIEGVLGSTAFGAFVREAFERRAPLTRRETSVCTPEGEDLTIGTTTVPLLDESDVFLGMLVLFTDLTTIRLLETRLRDSQILAELGEMTAGIAHEFRNSLSTILGYLKLAQRPALADEVIAKVRKAEEEAAQLSAAVESLLAFAKPVALQPQRIALRPLIVEILGRLEPSSQNVRFTLEGEATIDGDPALLARAIQNVIRNAIESIQMKQTSGLVEIALHNGQRTVEIRDNGIGIDPKDAARFVLPFQSGKPSGFGLGLALAKKIAVLHGGTIHMSGTPGQGAVVTLELRAPVVH